MYRTRIELTIQNNVSLAKLLYWSIVDRTLKMRHTKTTMNLQREKTHYYRLDIMSNDARGTVHRITNKVAIGNPHGRR